MPHAKILIVAARFNELVSKSLVSAAQERLTAAGIPAANVSTVWVPGSFEIPLVAREAALTKAYDAVICLGAVIRGETPHFDYVAGQAAAGVMRAALDTGVPIVFGVLTTDTVDQALNRAGLKYGNKGADAASCALETIQALKTVRGAKA